jgi:hypothetical protein
MRSIVIHTVHLILSGSQVKEDEVCGACGICEGEVHMGFCWRYLRLRDHLENISADGRILEGILKGIGWEGMDFVRVAQDRDEWQKV